MFCVSITKTREYITFLVYMSLLLDNMLLTVIVPILPDYLVRYNENQSVANVPKELIYKNFDLHYVPGIISKHPLAGNSVLNFSLTPTNKQNLLYNNITNNSFEYNRNNLMHMEEENGAIGILLASKAFVQLAFNPIVGQLTNRFGYRIPIVVGTLCIFGASIIFAIGESYMTLFFARSLQGIGSACIAVCGMSLIAQLYPEEEKRSKIMGIVLGSIALGVLIGYPFGGILYDFVSKSAPFYIIAVLLLFIILLQCLILDLNVSNEIIMDETQVKWWPFLSDQTIFLVVCAIWVSTSAMAILEPCLPLWLLLKSNLHPKKWQLGTVFIPDSIGYLIGTNFFGSIAYKVGQLRISVIALILVGISCIIIPNATSMFSLLFPHFGLGIGIGVLDAALVPLLAALVDAKYNDANSGLSDFHYGVVYAIQQTAVSLAYSFAPLIGGELSQKIGFAWLMRIIGAINLIYGPILVIFTAHINLKYDVPKTNDILLKNVESQTPNYYKRFYNSID